jgi:L-ascorbate metabolism protein UlaG (beta-lactamase superfamily)
MKKKKMIILVILLAIVGLFIAVNLFFKLAPQIGGKPDASRIASLAKNSHYDGKRFKNSVDLPVILPKSLWKIIKLQFAKNPGRIPEQPLPSVLPEFSSANPDSLSVIWLGHSSVLIRMNNQIILTDPVFSKRASPVNFAGPKAFSLTTPFSPDDLPFPDIILLSHDHFDHFDYKAISAFYLQVKTFLVPLGVRDHLIRWGVPSANIVEFDWWQSWSSDSNLQFMAAPAQHFSGRKKQDNTTLWCSWVISNKNQKIYFSGDTGYGPHFKEVGEKFGPFDITLMECGAYGKYWPNIHMTPEQTAQAHIDLKGKILLPVHWGKFNLAFHPWKEPVERLSAIASRMNITMATPIIGQQYTPGHSDVNLAWWVDL